MGVVVVVIYLLLLLCVCWRNSVVKRGQLVCFLVICTCMIRDAKKDVEKVAEKACQAA